jgi:hypothetical protein
MNPRIHSDMVLSREDSPDSRMLGSSVFPMPNFSMLDLLPRTDRYTICSFYGLDGLILYQAIDSVAMLLEYPRLNLSATRPSHVIRGCHLIPAFADGRTSTLLTVPRSMGRCPDETNDWAAIYVMMYVPLIWWILLS